MDLRADPEDVLGSINELETISYLRNTGVPVYKAPTNRVCDAVTRGISSR